jgi:hypothetical protein
MKNVFALMLFTACTSAVVVAGARPPAPKPVLPRPTPVPTVTAKPNLPPYIASARPTPVKDVHALRAYSDGPISYDVEIVNPSNTPLATFLHATRPANPSRHLQGVPTVPVNVAPHGHTVVTLVDPNGLDDGCSKTTDSLFLVATDHRASARIETTPTCTFTFDESDPMRQMSDDTIEANTRGRLAAFSARVDPPRCGAQIIGHATVKNGASAAAINASLALNGAGAQRLPSPFAPGRSLSGEFHGGPFRGDLGTIGFILHADGVPIYAPGYHMTVRRSCSLSVQFIR